jgi:hypothetical protein
VLIDCPSVSARVSVDMAANTGAVRRGQAGGAAARRGHAGTGRESSACAKPALATETMAEAGRADTVSPWATRRRWGGKGSPARTR